MSYKNCDTSYEKHCLQCGDEITYGRADKKFCSTVCRHAYWNGKTKDYRTYHLRVLNAIDKNYRILDRVIKMKLDSLDLMTMVQFGFRPGVYTASRRIGKHHQEYFIFEIRFQMSESKVYGIKRASDSEIEAVSPYSQPPSEDL